MELFVKIIDGVVHEHPIFGDNFRQAFPDVDIDNLPPEFSRFVRVPMPKIGVYEVYEGVTYERSGDVFTDVHHVRQMTYEEKLAKQNSVKDSWAANGLSSWVFDEETCRFYAPKPYPNDGKLYQWDEALIDWIEVSAK